MIIGWVRMEKITAPLYYLSGQCSVFLSGQCSLFSMPFFRLICSQKKAEKYFCIWKPKFFSSFFTTATCNHPSQLASISLFFKFCICWEDLKKVSSQIVSHITYVETFDIEDAILLGRHQLLSFFRSHKDRYVVIYAILPALVMAFICFSQLLTKQTPYDWKCTIDLEDDSSRKDSSNDLTFSDVYMPIITNLYNNKFAYPKRIEWVSKEGSSLRLYT